MILNIFILTLIRLLSLLINVVKKKKPNKLNYSSMFIFIISWIKWQTNDRFQCSFFQGWTNDRPEMGVMIVPEENGVLWGEEEINLVLSLTRLRKKSSMIDLSTEEVRWSLTSINNCYFQSNEKWDSDEVSWFLLVWFSFVRVLISLVKVE